MNIHEHPHYSFVKAILVYSIAVLFLFYEMGLQVSPSVMAFQLMKSFHIEAAGLGLVAGAYFCSYSFTQLPAGLLYDRLGARLLVTLATLICVLGIFLFGRSDTVFFAAFSRFLMGFGSAFAFTGVLVVSAFWFKPHHFAFLAGMAQFFAAIGAMGGAYPVALLVKYLGWRPVTVYWALFGLLLALLSWLIIRDHPKEKCSPSLVKTPKIKESIYQVFKRSQNWWAALYAFTSWGPVILFAALWGAPFLVTRFQVSNQLAASSLSAIWVGMGLGSPFFGWLSDYIKRRVSILVVSSLLGLIATGLLIYAPNLPFWTSYIILFFLGAAGCSQVLTFALIKDANRPTVIATAIGFNNMAVVLGGAIFQPLVGILLNKFSSKVVVNGVSVYTTSDYRIALIIMPLCYLICLLVSAFCLKETFCQPLYLKKQEN